MTALRLCNAYSFNNTMFLVVSNFLVASLSFYFHNCQSLEDHEETKEVSKRVQLLLKEETAAVQTKLVRNFFLFLFFRSFSFWY